MKHATALLLADTRTENADIRRAAEEAQDQDTRLAVVLYAPFPTIPINAFGALPYGGITTPDEWPDLLHAAQSAARDRTDEIEAILSDVGTAGDVRPLFSPVPEIRERVALSSRTADLALFAPNLREDEDVFREMLHGVLFGSPIGAMLNALPRPDYSRVMLAWNDSFAAARAAHLALPILLRADEVQIACFDPPAYVDSVEVEPGREVATWLSHHGCRVTVSQFPSGGKEIGACILDRAGEAGTELVVAGAYGHSRLRQAVFGGTSRTLIEQQDLPVFLAH